MQTRTERPLDIFDLQPSRAVSCLCKSPTKIFAKFKRLYLDFMALPQYFRYASQTLDYITLHRDRMSEGDSSLCVGQSRRIVLLMSIEEKSPAFVYYVWLQSPMSLPLSCANRHPRRKGVSDYFQTSTIHGILHHSFLSFDQS